MIVDAEKLQAVKARTWFYEFDLPDGSRTRSSLPADWLPVHLSRRRHLAQVIAESVADPAGSSAIDFASHEGYFTFELAKRFGSVRGFDYRAENVSAARLMAEVLNVQNVEFVEADLETMAFDERLRSDFVLVYGLLYHVENPIRVLRLAAQLARSHILVETQVFPFDLSGRIEDGGYQNQRPVEGVFALAPDYPEHREGGASHLALIPSLNAVVYLLKTFGFDEVRTIAPAADDYEQYRRGSRVIVFGEKSTRGRRLPESP